MKRFGKWIVSVLAVLLIGLAGSASAGSPRPAQYTVMFYMCGSDLEFRHQRMSGEISEIMSSRFNTSVISSVGLLGGTPRWAGDRYDPDVLSVVKIESARGSRAGAVDTFPLAPMDDPSTLAAFMDYCYDRYPAEHYILVISDHGGGPLNGCCEDLISGGIMSTLELKEAFEKSRLAERGLDIVTFDCCLMGSAEVAGVISPYARYMVATEDIMYGIGFDWLYGLENDASLLDTAVRIADSTCKYNRGKIRSARSSALNSVSVVDLQKMPALIQAVDNYFSGKTQLVNQNSFSLLFGRRKESVSFGLVEKEDSAGLDLVDIGSLITQLEEDGDGGALLQAVREAVPYHAADVEGCLGLTLYHPCRNRTLAADSMETYAGLGFAPSYVDYVIRYTSIMTDVPLARWADLITGVPGVTKDNRVRFFLPLTDEQTDHFGSAFMKVFLREEDGSYRFTYVTDQTDLKESTKEITGEFTGTALYAADAGGNLLSSPLPYALDPNGNILIPAYLTLPSADGTVFPAQEALICCEAGPDKTLRPGSVLIRDHLTHAWTGGFLSVFGDYSHISVPIQTRRETRDANGTLLPFDEWETVSAGSWDMDIDGSWSFRFVNDTLDAEKLFASFEILDSQSNRYASDLHVVHDPNPGPAEVPVRVEYDDSGILLIMDLKLKVSEDRLWINAEVSHLADLEAKITATDLAVNGTPLNFRKVEVGGQGDNWGLLKGEKQPLNFTVPMELLNGIGSITQISFTLNYEDPVSQEVFGSVPVYVTLYLEL